MDSRPQHAPPLRHRHARFSLTVHSTPLHYATDMRGSVWPATYAPSLRHRHARFSLTGHSRLFSTPLTCAVQFDRPLTPLLYATDMRGSVWPATHASSLRHRHARFSLTGHSRLLSTPQTCAVQFDRPLTPLLYATDMRGSGWPVTHASSLRHRRARFSLTGHSRPSSTLQTCAVQFDRPHHAPSLRHRNARFSLTQFFWKTAQIHEICMKCVRISFLQSLVSG